ncbi:hypothetical protein RN001_011687 [Aquatica leii]|uniref:Allantoate amidinohydrolase n=1 Tax=Aquatica leii TaxID=1421715 RepID=A0AAN7SP67_9COLE|nr:hypothetical protein RN001_011687 [Aquatica leii]
MSKERTLPAFTELHQLSSELNGSKIVFATDDWFAPAENLLKEEEPIFQPDVFTEFGKLMDGWETRRKRIPGHDWCIIKLGIPGVIHGVEVDTAFFTGNFAPRISIQAANLTEDLNLHERKGDMIGTAATTEVLTNVQKINFEAWKEILPMTHLGAGNPDTRHNYFAIRSNEVWTHVRLNMYPDGGIARFRIYGEVSGTVNDTNKIIDLMSLLHGGMCKGYSNAHYGHPKNLTRPQPSKSMADGWETARRLDRPAVLEADENGILKVTGNEWAVFKLGAIGNISHIQIDTAFFQGNFPDSVKIDGVLMTRPIHWNNANIEKLNWQTILSPKKLRGNQLHDYKDEIEEKGPFSHVRITIAPDGGISRVRIYGCKQEKH